MRALAALGVVLWHYNGMFHQHPWPVGLAPFYRGGGLLVDFFFALSGFVLARAYGAAGRRQQWSRNVRQRIARIYPLHLATLLACAMLELVDTARGHHHATNGPYDFVLNLLLLQSSGLQQGYSFNAPSWSISTEFICNVAFLWLLAKLPRRWAACMGVSAAAGALVLMHTGILNHRVPIDGQLGGVLDLALLRTWVGFSAGVGAWFALGRWGPALASRFRQRLAPGADLSALGLITLVGAYLSETLVHTPLLDTVLATVVFPALILSLALGRRVAAVLRWRPWVYLGEISYSIYLVHFPLIALALTLGHRLDAIRWSSGWTLLGFVLLVIALASLSYRFIEQPGKRLIGGEKRSESEATDRARATAPARPAR